MRYDIYNPTAARRIIYDGIVGSQKKINVAPGETLYDVQLAGFIAGGFTDGSDGNGHDLWVREHRDDQWDLGLKTAAASHHQSQAEFLRQQAMRSIDKVLPPPQPQIDPTPVPEAAAAPPPSAMPPGYHRYMAPLVAKDDDAEVAEELTPEPRERIPQRRPNKVKLTPRIKESQDVGRA